MSVTVESLFRLLSKHGRITITVDLGQPVTASSKSPITPKPPPPPPPAAVVPATIEKKHDTGLSFSLLESVGIDGDDLIRLSVNHSPERIGQVVAHVNSSKKPVRSKAGYVRRALEHGWYKSGS